MEVYVEYALAENFCMDFCLLYAAKKITKNAAGYGRLCIASALGAAFAVLFPLFNLNGAAAIAVKLLSGGVLCLAAGRFPRLSRYIKFTAAFFVFTFVLGGGLIAVFSLAGIAYSEGGGVILSSVPVGIPLFCALALVAAAKKIFSKFLSKNIRTQVDCRIYAGQSQITVKAFFDSGNKVFFRGSPVSVLPEEFASRLTDVSRIKTFVSVHTVSGKGKLPLFTAEKVEIHQGEKVTTHRGVLFCVTQSGSGVAVLHPYLAEA